MINKDYFSGKKITVLGLARSGVAAAELLLGLGAQVYASDSRDNQATSACRQALIKKGAKIELGRHSPDFIVGKDMVVISPGIPYNCQSLIWARENHIPAISEIELGWMLCPGTVIAVTGSNGKTTVTTLIAAALQTAGKRVFTCGNIGRPICAEVEKIGEGDFVSLETSSFQLEATDKFKPKVAVILNFSQNHLDRHNRLDDYLAAKKRIFANQDKDDYLVLNRQDPVVKGLAAGYPGKALYFQEENGLNQNQAAVLAVVSIFGVSKDICIDSFSRFKGVEHRMEPVGVVNGVSFINDSKSTSVEATLWALKALERPVILIAGGRDKKLDYRAASELLRRKAKAVILIGEARDKIKRALSGFSVFFDASGMQEAVELAFKAAGPGDCVLLSPMCASFDMFSDFEERGRVFKEAVYALIAKP